MKLVNSFDEKIKQCLTEETNQIEASKNLFQNIKTEIEKKGDDYMKFRLTTKKLVAVCILCLTTVVCIAAPKISSWTGHSSGDTEITTFPSEKEVKELVGYTPKYVESLPQGFKFKNANVVETQGNDESGNAVVNLKELSIFYERENKANEKELLSFIASNKSEDLFNQEHNPDLFKQENISTFNNITLYYDEMPYKFVPPDYELTEEDKKAMESGDLEISYGSSEVENNLMQFVSWYENGMDYLILGSDVNLTKEQLFEMAQTVISEAE